MHSLFFLHHRLVLPLRQTQANNTSLSVAQLRSRRDKLRSSCREVYHGLSLLLNFRVLNQLAIAKLLAHHDRLASVSWRGASAAFLPVVSLAPFYASEQLPELMLKIEVMGCEIILGSIDGRWDVATLYRHG
jgi:hypothetical protein